MCCWRVLLLSLSSYNTLKCNWNVDDMRLIVNKQQADVYCIHAHFHQQGYCFWHACSCTNSLPFTSTEAEFHSSSDNNDNFIDFHRHIYALIRKRGIAMVYFHHFHYLFSSFHISFVFFEFAMYLYRSIYLLNRIHHRCMNTEMKHWFFFL